MNTARVHKAMPAKLKAGEKPDLACVRLVADCTDDDPPPGELVTAAWENVTCPACLTKRSLYGE